MRKASHKSPCKLGKGPCQYVLCVDDKEYCGYAEEYLDDMPICERPAASPVDRIGIAESKAYQAGAAAEREKNRERDRRVLEALKAAIDRYEDLNEAMVAGNRAPVDKFDSDRIKLTAAIKAMEESQEVKRDIFTQCDAITLPEPDAWYAVWSHVHKRWMIAKGSELTAVRLDLPEME
jgi:hypothetical protein